MKSIARILILIIGLSYCCGTAWASWTGPQEIVTGSWGSSPSQFYFGSGDTEDSFPRNIGIDGQSRIFVNDEYNARVQVFNNVGSLVKVIVAPEGVNKKLGWPYNIYVHPNGNFVAGYDGSQKFFFDESGNLVKKIDVFGDAFPTLQGFIFYVQDNKYDFYSPTGQLIRTSSTRPSELGVVSENALADNQYKITITYPDKTYYLTSDATFMKYVRDTRGNVYGVNDGGVWRFNQCGKEVAELLMPVNQTETITSKTSGKTFPLPVEYGQPVVASNGDVYTWKKSKLKYRIVKWTWQDDSTVPSGPDAPTGLTVTPSTTGLYLAWTASAQDPGCVTGYEIARATTSGGVFSTVGTVDKGVVKYNDTTATAGTTYYYKVRAKAGSEYSQYTSEVSGKK